MDTAFPTWRRRLARALLLAALAGAVPASACVLVFGQGRNYDRALPARNQEWDEVNAAFNLAVRAPLEAAGLKVNNLVLPVAATDLPTNLRGLLAEVTRRGCTRVVETTVFADPSMGLLIMRVRVYPVLGLEGAASEAGGARIGASVHTEQREFSLDARTLARVDPARIGRLLGAEAIGALTRTAPLAGRGTAFGEGGPDGKP